MSSHHILFFWFAKASGFGMHVNILLWDNVNKIQLEFEKVERGWCTWRRHRPSSASESVQGSCPAQTIQTCEQTAVRCTVSTLKASVHKGKGACNVTIFLVTVNR